MRDKLRWTPDIIYDCPNKMCTTPIYTGECRPECWERYNKEMGKKPLTNGDRIRAMTDAELAYWMTHLHEDGHCLNERCQIFQDKTCEECVIDWLKQPVEVDHETD